MSQNTRNRLSLLEKYCKFGLYLFIYLYIFTASPI